MDIQVDEELSSSQFEESNFSFDNESVHSHKKLDDHKHGGVNPKRAKTQLKPQSQFSKMKRSVEGSAQKKESNDTTEFDPDNVSEDGDRFPIDIMLTPKGSDREHLKHSKTHTGQSSFKPRNFKPRRSSIRKSLKIDLDKSTPPNPEQTESVKNKSIKYQPNQESPVISRKRLILLKGSLEQKQLMQLKEDNDYAMRVIDLAQQRLGTKHRAMPLSVSTRPDTAIGQPTQFFAPWSASSKGRPNTQSMGRKMLCGSFDITQGDLHKSLDHSSINKDLIIDDGVFYQHVFPTLTTTLSPNTTTNKWYKPQQQQAIDALELTLLEQQLDDYQQSRQQVFDLRERLKRISQEKMLFNRNPQRVRQDEKSAKVRKSRDPDTVKSIYSSI
ncbi:hypothetical protein FGO68_gene1654 [Halteria grandinella]|uniref:Uncharacterized protein n=1 Tax=Halteria grandinella TaxID=5974 RepID=A0A8J8NEW5_HALGN|nr:hypothetical protein FGO68_gene1654 [Halteria grandinella]